MNGKQDTGLTLNQVKLVFVGALIFFKLAPNNNIHAWSWWWVLAPLWIFDVAVLAVALLIFIIAGIAKILETIINTPRR